MARIKAVGSLETAKKCIADGLEKVPAYKKFLEKEGKTGKETFDQLPSTSKKTYLLKFPYDELLPVPLYENPAIFASSGSSGNPFYWVYRKNEMDYAHLELGLKMLYSIDKKKTLLINAASLGSWVGGDLCSFVMKSVAIQGKYQFTVISPGTNLDEIVKIISTFEKYYDQIIIVSSPTVLAHGILKAEHLKVTFPYEKMRYVFIEEGFTEDFRIALQKKSGVDETNPIAYSLFGSADAETLGIESLPSVCLRKLCFHNYKFAAELGISPDFPHFFHSSSPNNYLEVINDEIWITKWQGIPLLRYNLHDRCNLYSWVGIQEIVKNYPFSTELEKKLAAIITHSPAQLPDLFAIFGRADSCINLGGTKIYEYVLDDVIRSAELSKYLTGLYKAKLSYQEFYAYIDMTVELKENIEGTPETLARIEDLIELKLAEINPEYRSDFETLYKQRREAIRLKSVKVSGVPWPTLSSKSETSIKIRGITPNEDGSEKQ